MAEATVKETACPDCGEMVRINSLRCWNCGGFMDRELEQRYLAMQSSSRPVIFSDESNPVSGGDSDSDENDGFQLKTPIARPISDTPKIPAAENDIIRIVPDEVSEAAPSSVEPATESGSHLETVMIETVAPVAEKTDKGKRLQAEPENGVAHSVATGGDALLEIAIKEEREARKRQKGRRVQGGIRTAGGGLVIFCPYGCRIEVKESHRGMTGRCPRCQAPFIVPVDPPMFKQSKGTETVSAAGESGNAAPVSDLFSIWLHDVRLHVVDPEKLKLKADSLAKDFTQVDFGFSKDLLLVASLTKAKKGGGLFAKGGSGKKEDIRAELVQYLAEKKPMEELPVGEKHLFDAADLPQLKVVQPAADRANNIFHGIPVFGTNRIAVQLPLTDKTPHPLYVSLGITEFWKFCQAVKEVYSITDLDADLGLPREPRYDSLKCHYTDTPIKALLDLELYQADPTVQLEVAGYQCGACKITVSEAGRKKENLGGKSPKGIAKAKCPKCSSKMGEHLLYSFKQDVAEPSMT